jgi:hypothetical protein
MILDQNKKPGIDLKSRALEEFSLLWQPGHPEQDPWLSVPRLLDVWLCQFFLFLKDKSNNSAKDTIPLLPLNHYGFF